MNPDDTSIKLYDGEAGEIRMVDLTDRTGNPTGGEATGVGINVNWQHGPRGQEGTDELAPATGAFVEDVILIAQKRLEFFQDSKFRCRENALAITKLEEALHWLTARRSDRAARGVEGKNDV